MGSSKTTRGGQITLHNWRMFMQVQGKLVIWALLGALIFTSAIVYLSNDTDTLLKAFHYLRFRVLKGFYGNHDVKVTIIYHGITHKNVLSEFLQHKAFSGSYENIKQQSQIYFLVSSLISFSFAFFILVYFKRKGEEKGRDIFVRGKKLVEPKELTAFLKKTKKLSDLKIDGRRLLKENFEVQHVLLDGSTGTGKSQNLMYFLDYIRARGDKAIIYDKGCSFVGKTFRAESDILLNPFDERCAFWDIWQDAETASDFENIANALIPQEGESDPFWVLAARTLFASTAYEMSRDNEPKTTERFLELMLKNDLSKLGDYLKDTEASSLVSEKASKIAISIKSILSAYIKSLRYLEGLDKPDANGEMRKPFSISKWVKNDNQRGFLYLSSNAQQHASLRPLISTWIDIASTSLLGLEETPHRRIWVIVDEMPTLHKLPSLPETIAEVRKFGGCFVIGIQSFAQLESNYGRTGARVIFDLLNTRLFFRSPSLEMAKVSSQDLGEQEIEEANEQYSYGSNEMRDGVSVGHQQAKIKQAVLATEIMDLEDLEFYLKNAGNIPLTKFQMKYRDVKNKNKPFIKRIIEKTQTGEALDELLAWNQLGAINMLDEEQRNKLFMRFETSLKGLDEKTKKESMREIQEKVNSYIDKADLDDDKQTEPSNEYQQKENDKDVVHEHAVNEVEYNDHVSM